jgi:flagellar basal-body rod modification protein FlgD
MTTAVDINQITGASTAAKPAAKTTINTLGVSDFLTLMTAQLKEQDPLKPLDSTAFVAQLAQFGTVSGIQNMQSSLNSLSTAMRSSQLLSGANLVGHEVLTAASSAMFSGTVLSGTVDVPAGTQQLTVSVTDASGQVLKHINVGAGTGTQTFQWDGTDDTGKTVAAGQYSFQAVATSGTSNQSLATNLYGQVGSVSLSADGTGLTVNTAELGAVGLSSVLQII